MKIINKNKILYVLLAVIFHISYSYSTEETAATTSSSPAPVDDFAVSNTTSTTNTDSNTETTKTQAPIDDFEIPTITNRTSTDSATSSETNTSTTAAPQTAPTSSADSATFNETNTSTTAAPQAVPASSTDSTTSNETNASTIAVPQAMPTSSADSVTFNETNASTIAAPQAMPTSSTDSATSNETNASTTAAPQAAPISSADSATSNETNASTTAAPQAAPISSADSKTSSETNASTTAAATQTEPIASKSLLAVASSIPQLPSSAQNIASSLFSNFQKKPAAPIPALASVQSAPTTIPTTATTNTQQVSINKALNADAMPIKPTTETLSMTPATKASTTRANNNTSVIIQRDIAKSKDNISTTTKPDTAQKVILPINLKEQMQIQRNVVAENLTEYKLMAEKLARQAAAAAIYAANAVAKAVEEAADLAIGAQLLLSDIEKSEQKTMESLEQASKLAAESNNIIQSDETSSATDKQKAATHASDLRKAFHAMSKANSAQHAAVLPLEESAHAAHKAKKLVEPLLQAARAAALANEAAQSTVKAALKAEKDMGPPIYDLNNPDLIMSAQKNCQGKQLYDCQTRSSHCIWKEPTGCEFKCEGITSRSICKNAGSGMCKWSKGARGDNSCVAK
ncbi:MAG: hypothetical protein Q8S21_04695 [Candidatus Paracaedibacteraceae bacterium]|nr:hypothetical protein [Candidatus Paracaedibacteraceae bacterium]